MDLSLYQTINNVIYLTEEQDNFSSLYIKVRKKENRILTDDDVKILPYLKRNEWIYREKSTERFKDYISKKEKSLRILDIGCGNGWFSNILAQVSRKNEVYGIDLNKIELEQAARVFKRNNLQFVYGDINKNKNIFKQQFYVVTLNSCIQYFPDFKALFSILKSFLKPCGEIHILDSPFYKASQVTEAKQRTLDYYIMLGFMEMASHYFHHTVDDLLEVECLYTNKNKLLNKIYNKKDSPFPWLRFTKQ